MPLSSLIAIAAAPVVVNCKVELHALLGLPFTQKVFAWKSYCVFAVNPVNVLEVAVPVKVPALIHVVDVLALYWNSYHAAPEIAGHVIVADVLLTDAAVNTGAVWQASAPVVPNVVDELQLLGVPFEQYVLAWMI